MGLGVAMQKGDDSAPKAWTLKIDGHQQTAEPTLRCLRLLAPLGRYCRLALRRSGHSRLHEPTYVHRSAAMPHIAAIRASRTPPRPATGQCCLGEASELKTTVRNRCNQSSEPGHNERLQRVGTARRSWDEVVFRGRGTALCASCDRYTSHSRRWTPRLIARLPTA